MTFGWAQIWSLIAIFHLNIPSSTSLTCYTPFDCSNQTITESSSSAVIRGYGYKSIFGQGASITNTECNTILCEGSNSCEKIELMDVACRILFEGSNSGTNAKNRIITTSYIRCASANSCAGSTLVAQTNVLCRGTQRYIFIYLCLFHFMVS